MRHSPSLPIMLICALGASLPAAAQYQTHVQKNDDKKPPPPRAVSVLEWVGDPGKPVASRIVPVTVFVNGRYEDGGLYLAAPAPLTVESETVYDLERAGVPKGTFYVAGGQNVDGAWFGYGQWKPLSAPKPPKKLQPSKNLPRVVQDSDPDKPHFKGSNPSSSQGGSGQSTGSSTSSPSSNDPDQPSLHRRNPSDIDTAASGAGSAPEDPDRPHLKKQSAASADSSASTDDGSPVSSVNEPDPDRPKLGRGKPADSQVQLQATKITGLPPDLQQMAAVSDASNRAEHVFSYPWPDPGDAPKMQAAVEALAIKAVLSNGSSPANQIGGASATPPSKTPAHTASKSALAHKVAPKLPPVTLSEKDFRAYELSYNGGATLVFTAKASIGPNNAGVTVDKYVTIIAQPDFNGDPQLRFQSVTDPKHLDITPRMRLVDAVDTAGDNQAELIFELRHESDRQFAIYRVRGTHAEQAFATESLPYVTPSHLSETKAN
jgi:hypothetical protein